MSAGALVSGGLAEAGVAKIDKMFPVTHFTMHVSEHHGKSMDHEGVYEMRIRLYTEKKMYYAAREGFDPISVMNDLFDVIEAQVKKDHGKAKDARKIKKWK